MPVDVRIGRMVCKVSGHNFILLRGIRIARADAVCSKCGRYIEDVTKGGRL